MTRILRMALLALAVHQPLSAQQQLTLRDAATAALSVHPAIALVDAGVARAAAAAREVSASLLPGLGVDATLTRFQEPMVIAPLHGFDPRTPPPFDEFVSQSALTLGYTLFDGGLRRARVARASATTAAARTQVAATGQLLLAETTRRYTNVLFTRELVAAHAARVTAMEQERARAARQLEQGRVARVVLLRAEAALSAARAEHATTQVQVANAERELARVMGASVTTVAQANLADVRISTPVVSRDSALAAAAATNQELARLELQLRAARAGRAEAKSQWWPRLQLGGRYTRYASSLGDAGGEWQTGVQLSYAVFTAGARPAAAQRAQAEMASAEAELGLAQLRVASSVDAALAALQAAQARAEAWRAAVMQSAEVARIERLSLHAGAGTQADYLLAEAELLRARAALADAQHSELVARVELARAMGVLSFEWLVQNLESGS